MSTPVNTNDMRNATIRRLIAEGLDYNSPPYNQGDVVVIPPLQPVDVVVIPPLQVYDSPPPNQIMARYPRDPPSNERPPMREFLANGGYLPQRLVFQPGATQQSPAVPLSERTEAHRSLAVPVACIQLEY